MPTRADVERADLAMLSGAAAEELLRAVLQAEGVALDRWSTHAVHHRPGVGVTVGWTVTWRSGQTQGEEYLLGTTTPIRDRDGLPPGVQRVQMGDRTVHVWRHPTDPALPGLPAASSYRALGDLLGSAPIDLALVTYRPLRRAVLRAWTPERTVYLKVVRPHTAALLERRHRLLAEAGLPVAPARLAPDGVLVLDEVPGEPLTKALAADGAAGLAPGQVLRMLDRLPAAASGLPRRPSWSDRVLDHADAAAAALPEQSARIAALARDVTDLLATSDPGPVVPTHGDLHDGNLLLDAGRIVGLLDIDAVGPGHRVDDLACLLGHLSVLPAMAPEVHRHVPGALPRWVEAFGAVVDPVALHARAAAVALSLVAGARREGGSWTADARARLEVAEGWVTGAHCLRGLSSRRPRPLMTTDHRR